MKTKIKHTIINDFEDYRHVVITDENEEEYELNFPITAGAKEILETWEQCETWRII